MKSEKVKCPRCKSENTSVLVDGNGNKHDDQTMCLDCELVAYNEEFENEN